MGTVLVTGGSRGIGRAIVEALVAEPSAVDRRVAFTWRVSEAASREVERAAGGRARAFHLDLRDHGRPDALVGEIEEDLGPIEGLVNNAALRRESLLAMMTDEDWDEVLDSNLGGLFRCCRAVLRGMMVRRRGAIVNLGSLSAFRGVAGETAYAAAKAGILGLTRALAREVGRRRVRVNAVVPGFVATEMTSGLPSATVDFLRAGECLPEGTSAASVADAVLFLLSDRAAAVTGQTLVVDAGTSA
jgi:3-oxoacyl-[acyl-carrier protein] reductase